MIDQKLHTGGEKKVAVRSVSHGPPIFNQTFFLKASYYICRKSKLFPASLNDKCMLTYHRRKKHVTVYTVAHAEASCTSQIRTARAVREELGESTAVRSGVADWAKVSYDHSERGVEKVVKKQGTRLEVRLSEVHLDGVDIPWIDPRDWIQYIVDNGLLSLFAGVKVDQQHLAPQVWRDF